ncbi:MAG TPA: HlyD family efflux transporter periplasmic adaptor subunit [Acidobacteriota bacterium]|jgi:HlyD family secretion protein
MDIPRKSVARKKLIRRIVYFILVAGLLTAITVAVNRLKPAAPLVEAVWPDTVKRGSMLRQVHGLGTLVPEDIRWIPASTEGRVERILAKPGAIVTPSTILLELSNPVLQRDVLDAEMQVKATEADYTTLAVQLESQRLDQAAAAARVQSDYNQAKMKADTDEQLVKEGLIADLTRKLSKVTADELANRNSIEQKRLSIAAESIRAQLAAQRTRVDQSRALHQLKKSQAEALHVRAGMSGVLQEMPIQLGQQVAPGTNLARVSDPTRLKAQLRIAETQAKDIRVGQKTEIDTRNGVVMGLVSRIDPASQNGTVAVDVALDGPLPSGARPDLNVDGTIELERLENILYVGRPGFGQEKSNVTLFKIEEGGKFASRVQVKLGRSSVNTIEILGGLKQGDQVILSDMAAWDGYDRVRLK